LAEWATSKASSLRAARPAPTACRRWSNSLWAATLEFPGEDLSALGQSVRLAPISPLFSFLRLLDKRINPGHHRDLLLVQFSRRRVIEHLMDFLLACRQPVLKLFQFVGRKNLLYLSAQLTLRRRHGLGSRCRRGGLRSRGRGFGLRRYVRVCGLLPPGARRRRGLRGLTRRLRRGQSARIYLLRRRQLGLCLWNG
jgi:hypothetical protein